MAARSYEPGSGQAVIIRKVSYSKISLSVSPATILPFAGLDNS